MPEQIRAQREPQTGAEYLLYRPSGYRSDSQWPLVVVCHSSFGDSPNRQTKEWTLLAETNGFLVAAPALEYERHYNPLGKDDPSSHQNILERRILGTVRHVQAAHSVSEDRILLYGYGRGAEPALYVGLRHPDLFRAISVVGPEVNTAVLSGIQPDPSQPVHVRAKIKRMLKLPESIQEDQTAALLAWLSSNGVKATIDSSANVGKEDAQHATEFFELAVRKEPWLHIQAFTPDPQKPLTLQFKVRASFSPGGYDWKFPNELTYHEASPVYTFDAPGEYAVKLIVPSPALAKKPTQIARSIIVTVPGGHVRWQ